jgi:hypothetical protein
MLDRLSVLTGKALAPIAGRPCFFPPPDTMTNSGSKSWELGSASAPSLSFTEASYFNLRFHVVWGYAASGGVRVERLGLLGRCQLGHVVRTVGVRLLHLIVGCLQLE